MRNRWALWVMLASALTFLASLYLPWVEGPVPSGSGVLGLLNLVSTEGISGWASGVGYAAALAALALAAASVAVLMRPSLADRLPLAACALLTAYFAVAGIALLRQHYRFDARLNDAKYPWTYGAYLGLAASVVAVLTATAFSGRALLPRGALDAVGRLMALGLIVSFLLPWHRVPAGLPQTHGTTFTFLGIVAPSVVLATVMVIAGGTRVRAQALCWVGAAVLTFGAFGFGEASLGRAYGFWLALAFALALLIVATVALRESPRPAQPSLADAVLVGAAALFIVSLFLPWQQFCAPQNRCFSEGGWTMQGSTAAVLAALAGIAVLLRSHVNRVSELVAAMGLLVATAGFTMSSLGPGIGFQFAYGSIVGFSATALLVAVTAARSGRPRLDRRRRLARLLPIAASLALIAAVALPWWDVLPTDWATQSTVLRDWFAVAGLLLSLHLLWCWLRRVQGSSRVGWELALVPPAVLTLVSLELITQRGQGMTWGGGILVGLCLLLTALGWIEVRGGLEKLRVPEVLRVDRLPGAET